MNNGIEMLRTTFADSMPWIWYARSSQDEGGEWYGKTGKATYRIRVPAWPHDVDTPPSLREQRMTVEIGDDDAYSEECIDIPYTSVAEAKRMCLRHVLTGDTAEMRAIEETFNVEESEYQMQVSMANSNLNAACRRHDPPRLPWQSEQLFPMEYMFAGTRGEYHVHFEPERRWVVQFVAQGQIVAEQCFFTREITRLACSLHSHCGEWHGMFLTKNSSRQLLLFS